MDLGAFNFSRTKAGPNRRRRRGFPKWYKIDRLQAGELPGVLVYQRVRCGKSGCRCLSGREEDLHGPYAYRVWRDEKGKQRKAYVKAADLEAVQAAIDRRRFRLAAERRKRNAHMRRGMGRGRAADEWKRDRRPDALTQLTRLGRALDRLLSGR